MPDSSNFDTTCDNDNYDNSNTGPAFNPPADADQFVLQCRDPANSSHTGVTQTKTVSYGDLVAMGYPLGASNRHNGRCSVIERWALASEHAHSRAPLAHTHVHRSTALNVLENNEKLFLHSKRVLVFAISSSSTRPVGWTAHLFPHATPKHCGALSNAVQPKS